MIPLLPVALLALSAIGPLPARAQGPLPASDATAHLVPQALVMVANTPDISDCTALDVLYELGGWPQVTGVRDIAILDSLLRMRYSAQPDGQADFWSPQLARVLTGGGVTGDCDDLATTAVALAICAGVPAQDLGLLMTAGPDGADDRHLVALYHAPDGAVWTFGDTLRGPAPLDTGTSHMIAWTRADQLDLWWSLDGALRPRATAVLNVRP